MARIRSRGAKATVVGGGGTLLAIVWNFYSTLTTVAQLPTDATGVVKMIADPPIYLPWLMLAGFILLLAWSVWPHEKADEDHPGGGGTVMHNPVIHNYYAPIEELAKTQEVIEPKENRPVLIQPDNASHGHTSGPVLSGSAARFPVGLYVGMVIVSANRLKSEKTLEIAIRAFNGTGQSLRIIHINGRIRAGTGNLRDQIELPKPNWLHSVTHQPVAPNAEFMVALDQPLNTEATDHYLEALANGKTVSLDLRQLHIVAEVEAIPGTQGRLPLWDGVNLNRRDDIFTNRNTILSVGVAVETDTALPLKMATGGDETK